VRCALDSFGALRFNSKGVTVVDLMPGDAKVRYTMPDLRIRPNAWPFGQGSTCEWVGSCSFVDESGGMQCNISFGPTSEDNGADTISGTIRDSCGFEIGRVRGSWLGPVICDNEIIWRGPRHHPAPY